jgi:hypothetical protein
MKTWTISLLITLASANAFDLGTHSSRTDETDLKSLNSEDVSDADKQDPPVYNKGDRQEEEAIEDDPFIDNFGNGRTTNKGRKPQGD